MLTVTMSPIDQTAHTPSMEHLFTDGKLPLFFRIKLPFLFAHTIRSVMAIAVLSPDQQVHQVCGPTQISGSATFDLLPKTARPVMGNDRTYNIRSVQIDVTLS